MKILAISDEEVAALWDNYQPERLADIDLIISCGDLKPSYLRFLVTMSHAPVLYIHGNHDARYPYDPPEGCDCIDDSLVVYNGVRILGLGGSMRYNPGPFQYTEKQMSHRIARLRFALWRAKGVDIVVTHAAPEGLGDMDDTCHKGFSCFRTLMEKYHPSLFLHGHVHRSYNITIPREHEYEGTRIINVCPRTTLDIPDSDLFPKSHKNLLRLNHVKEE